MTAINIQLSDAQADLLKRVAQDVGKSADEFVVDLINKEIRGLSVNDRRSAFKAGRGLWKDRADLPDFAALRREWDRS